MALKYRRDLLSLPAVETVDGMQGREAEMVFYDCVGSKADNKRAMGLTGDSETNNVAHTRAKVAVIIITTDKLLQGKLALRENDSQNNNRGFRKSDIYPIAKLDWSNGQGYGRRR